MKYNVTDHTVLIPHPVPPCDAINDTDQETASHHEKTNHGKTYGKKAVDEPIADPSGKAENFIPFEEL